MILVSFFHGIHKTQIKTVAVDEIISISVPNMASCYKFDDITLTSGLFSRSWATEEMQLVFTGRIELPMITKMNLMNPLKACTWWRNFSIDAAAAVKPHTFRYLPPLLCDVSFPLPHHPLKLHVKYRRVQDDTTFWIVGVLLKRQRGWLLWCFGPPLLFLLQSYRQRVTVDVIDLGVVLCSLWFPEEGQRVDEAGRPLHRFDRHGVQRVASGHSALIDLGSLRLPGEEDGTSCSNGFNLNM